jgi:hypothetical protein
VRLPAGITWRGLPVSTWCATLPVVASITSTTPSSTAGADTHRPSGVAGIEDLACAKITDLGFDSQIWWAQEDKFVVATDNEMPVVPCPCESARGGDSNRRNDGALLEVNLKYIACSSEREQRGSFRIERVAAESTPCNWPRGIENCG